MTPPRIIRASRDLTTDLLGQLLPRFRQARILVMGDVMLDEYLVGEVRRISPEAPVPIVEVTGWARIPGGAANVACNIASLGGRAVLVGVLGDDEDARHVTSALAANELSTEGLILTTDRPTTSKTRVVSGQQQIVRVDRETKAPISDALARRVIESFDHHIAEVDACLLSDYAKGLLTAEVCSYVMNRAREFGKPVIVDPKDLSFQKYAGCSVITPNLREAELASGFDIHSESDLLRSAALLQRILVNTSLLITRGPDGMTLFRPESEPVHASALSREVFDVTGAGDTVVSTLTLAVASGAELEDAMILSNVAASIVVQKSGTATISVQELLEAVGNRSSVRSGLNGGSSRDSVRSYSSVTDRSCTAH